MSTLTHDPIGFMPAPATASSAPAMVSNDVSAPPVGYRWVSKRWKVMPDGTRDYAAYHGKTAFNVLLPVSSKLRPGRR